MLSKLVKGIVGAGATIYAAKKIVDLYARHEGEDLMTPEEYEKEMEARRQEGQEPGFFNYDLIENKSDADEFFQVFLHRVEDLLEVPSKVMRIADIEKLIPYQATGLKSQDEYDYLLMSMLAGGSSSDYFVFLGNSGMKARLKRELSSKTRDNSYWRKFKDQRFIINPKYIKE